MPKPKDCQMGLLFVGNGRYTSYCTCGWVEIKDRESPYECATDWYQHYELTNG